MNKPWSFLAACGTIALSCGIAALTYSPPATPLESAPSVSEAPSSTSLSEPVTFDRGGYTVEVVATHDDPWLTAADGTQHFEDGSWLDADGTQGCTVGMPCDTLPPVPAEEPTTPNGGYYPTLTLRPCPMEDADNCYWDAARMGNGQGTSFITVDGITYYPR